MTPSFQEAPNQSAASAYVASFDLGICLDSERGSSLFLQQACHASPRMRTLAGIFLHSNPQSGPSKYPKPEPYYHMVEDALREGFRPFFEALNLPWEDET